MIDKNFLISDNFEKLDDIIFAEEIELLGLEVDEFWQMSDVNEGDKLK